MWPAARCQIDICGSPSPPLRSVLLALLRSTFFISSLAFSMLRMFQLQIKWENRLKEAAEAAAAKAAAGCKVRPAPVLVLPAVPIAR